MGVYSIDSITKYVIFYEIIKKRNGKYPFAIFNTDKHNKPDNKPDVDEIEVVIENLKKEYGL